MLRVRNKSLNVLTTKFCAQLGWEYLDYAASMFVTEFFKEYVQDLGKGDKFVVQVMQSMRYDKSCMEKIRMEWKKAKEHLSASHMAPPKFAKKLQDLNINIDLSRTNLQSVSAPFLEKTISLTQTDLENANSARGIDDVVMLKYLFVELKIRIM